MKTELIGARVVFPTAPAGQVTLSRKGENVVIERRTYASREFADFGGPPVADRVESITCPPEALRAILRLFADDAEVAEHDAAQRA